MSEQSSDDEGGEVDVGENVTVHEASSPTKRGPKRKRSLVWEYFISSSGSDTAKCRVCEKVLKNPNATNLKKHLATTHRSEHAEVIRQEKATAPISHTPNHAQQVLSFASSTKYKDSSQKQKSIDEKLSCLVATPNCSLSFILSEPFQELLKELDSRYNAPKSRNKLVALLRRKDVTMKKAIVKLLETDRKIAISLDIWTQRGMVRSYIAVTAHFFCDTTGRLEKLLLAVRPMFGRHTAYAVKQLTSSILGLWGISDDNISRFVTDNGSNVVAAFRECLIMLENNSEAERLAEIEQEPASFWADYNLEEENAEKANEECEQQEYDRREEEMATTFQQRLSCVAHDLQLVLHSTVDRHLRANTAVRQLLNVLSKFKKSVIATEQLIQKCGKTVVLPAKTRWNSLFLVLERVFEIQTALNEVCVAQRWSSISGFVDELEALHKLLRPFYESTNQLQGDKHATISSVYPTVQNLLHMLSAAQDEERYLCLPNLVVDMREQLSRRFTRVVSPSSDRFDVTYALCSVLDPNSAWLLKEDVLRACKTQLINVVIAERMGPDVVEEAPLDPQQPTTSAVVSKFGGYAAAMLTEKRLRSAQQQQLETANAIVTAFLTEMTATAPEKEIDPFQYWVNCPPKWNVFAKLALDMLPIPATSASVERVFSMSGLCTSDRRNRVGPQLLQMKCMLHANAALLKI